MDDRNPLNHGGNDVHPTLITIPFILFWSISIIIIFSQPPHIHTKAHPLPCRNRNNRQQERERERGRVELYNSDVMEPDPRNRTRPSLLSLSIPVGNSRTDPTAGKLKPLITQSALFTFFYLLLS
jgi:hypothetical protein